MPIERDLCYHIHFLIFNSIWGFRKPLSQRFGLNWFQLIFTSIFLISLSMVPIAIQNSSQETILRDVHR